MPLATKGFATPTCLIENPLKLVSLRDMQKFYAATLTTLTWQLNSLWMEIGEVDARPKVIGVLDEIKGEVEKLNWMDISAQIDRFLRRLRDPAEGINTGSFDGMFTLFSELQGNIQHHLTRDLFLCIQNPKIGYISRPREIFSEAVLDAFPSASYDLLEGSRCFALDRWTASVVHLMRALECPLFVLGAVFGVSLAHTNWGPAIGEIESRVRDMHKDQNGRHTRTAKSNRSSMLKPKAISD